MDKRNGLNEKNKIYIGIFLGVFLALICPIMINECLGPENASGAISYFGTLLGATATIIAVTWTIDYSKKLSKEEREYTRKINSQNRIYETGLRFIRSLNYQLISVLFIDNFQISRIIDFYRNSDQVRSHCVSIMSEINNNYFEYVVIKKKLNMDERMFLQSYVNEYINDIKLLDERIIKLDENYQVFLGSTSIKEKLALAMSDCDDILKELDVFNKKYSSKYTKVATFIMNEMSDDAEIRCI